MIYREINLDLFETDYSYALAHCISADCKMGAGIAKEFRRRYPDIPKKVLNSKPKIGDVISYHSKGRMIFNLVTKKKYYHKPTYETFASAIIGLKFKCEDLCIKKIAIPLLGAGLDKLDWSENKKIIQNVFYHTDIEILVCKPQNKKPSV